MSVHAQSQRSRSRRHRTAESPQQNTFPSQSYASQPHPAMQHPLYDYNTMFAQQGMETPIFGFTNDDVIMADYTVEELGSLSMDGSMAQSLSPSWVDVGKSSPKKNGGQ